MERYGQVALLTCCSTLATETDQTAYGMLQQVVREVLQLVEVAEDPISRLQDQLKTVAKYASTVHPLEFAGLSEHFC